MQDIYSYSYSVFNIFVDNLNVYFKGDNYKITNAIFDFLTNKNSKYNSKFETFMDEKFWDLNSIKKVLMLMIASKAYILNYYDYIHNINKEVCQETLEELEDLDSKNIIKEFHIDGALREKWLEDFHEFINRPYIFQSQSKYLIIKNNKIKQVFRINPYEILDLSDFIDNDKFITSEITIQTLLNIYDESLEETISVSIDEDRLDNDNLLIKTFIKNLISHLKNDDKKIINYVKYMIANIYETIIIEIYGKNEDYKRFANLIYYIEHTEIDDIVKRFFQDYLFALNVIDAFLESNDYLLEGDLFEKREVYKEKGDLKLLRKLNPYYNEEEIVFKKIKETMEE